LIISLSTCVSAISVATPAHAQACSAFYDTPIDKTQLYALGSKARIPKNKLWLAFENFAISSATTQQSNKRQFSSPLRSTMSGGRYSNVVPDAVASLIFLELNPATGQKIVRTYADSIFYEAKALRPLVLNSSYPVSPDVLEDEPELGTFQIGGYLDALRYSPAGRAFKASVSGPVPRLVLLTTSGVTVSARLRQDATANGVAISQAIMCKDPLGNLYMGPLYIHNPSIYDSPRTIPSSPAHRPAQLR
jgi:hypothetical protein